MNKNLSSSARKALVEFMGLKDTESLLVISDATRREIGLSIFEAGKQITNKALYIEIPTATINGEEPPLEVAKLMQKVDVCICPTQKSLTHTDARRNATNANTRVGTMPGITIGTMSRCFSAEAKKIVDMTHKVAKKLKTGDSVRITTQKGTDITLPFAGREILPSTGVLTKIGSGFNLPSGEVYYAPLEGKTQGRVIFDASIAGIGILTDDVDVMVENGYAVSIKGGKQAQQLRSTLASVGKDAFAIAELGIGTNYKATICGDILEDEKVLGTIHIAFGNNKSMGGKIDVPIHIDGIVKSPTIYLNDEIIMQDGKMLI